MRLLHTSDWHLGQSFFGKSRADEHNAFIDWLLQQVEQQQIDAVIVAGDLFDTATPPSYARAIYSRLISAMSRLKCQLVLLGGNHDSVAMLNESKPLLAELGTVLCANGSDDISQQLITLKDRHGNDGALLCAVPYLRPRDMQLSQAGDSGNDKRLQLQQAIAEHYQVLFEAAQALRGDRNLPIIATGHLTTVGARSSDSERELYIGTLDAFPASAFPPVDYLALGHIHRSQKVAGSEHMRYCGSPIPLSFDELGRDKLVLQVTFEQRMPQITELTVPCFQPMARLKGDLAQVQAQLQQFEGRTDNTWLDIEVAQDDYLSDLHQRVAQLCQELPVEVLKVHRQRRSQRDGLTQEQQQQTLSELSVTEVFERRLEQEQFDGEQAQQRKVRLQSLFDQTRSQLEQSE